MDIRTLKSMSLPDGSVKRWSCGDVVLWEKASGRLPAEFQEVEWIYMPYSAYLNTLWRPSNDVLFSIAYKGTTDGYMFGCGRYPRLSATWEPAKTYNTRVFCTGNHASGIHDFEIPADDIVSAEMYIVERSTEAYVTVNGETIKHGAIDGVYPVDSADFSAAADDLFIGAWQYSATEFRNGQLYFYYCKASKNGTAEMELIPCYRKSDGMIGAYDLVRGIFFTNAGTASFTKGPDVA